MYKLKVTILVSVLALHLSEASVAIRLSPTIPDHERECYDHGRETWVSIGDSWQLPGQCAMAFCQGSLSSTYISYMGCGVGSVDPPCFMTSNNDLPYPHCCPVAVCPQSNEINAEVISNSEEINHNLIP